MSKPKGLYRNFVFTINNWTEACLEGLKKLKEISNYLVYGEEVAPTTGTPHLQGYCELKKRTRFNKLKSVIPRANILHRRGTAKQAADYAKKDGKIHEYGTMSRPGTRTDIQNMYDAIKEGKTDLEIQEADIRTYMRYYKAIDRVRFNLAMAEDEYEPVEVLVFWGAAGSGKTRRAYEIDRKLYNVVDTQWWDGYRGQETILFDDFYGGVKYSLFLRLTDGYKFQLPIKGGFTWKKWKRVIITSNKPPELWYTRGMTDALARRLKTIEEVGV